MHTCISSHGLKRSRRTCPRRVNAGNKNTPSTHHPRRRNVTTLMVGLKKRSHMQKSHPKSGEPQRYSWGTQKNPKSTTTTTKTQKNPKKTNPKTKTKTKNQTNKNKNNNNKTGVLTRETHGEDDQITKVEHGDKPSHTVQPVEISKEELVWKRTRSSTVLRQLLTQVPSVVCGRLVTQSVMVSLL